MLHKSRPERTMLAIVASALFLAPACRVAAPAPAALDPIAREFVILGLALGRHDAEYVDSYYGPEELRQVAERDSARFTIPAIRAAAESLLARLGETTPAYADSLVALRHDFLRAQLVALIARARIVAGERIPVDEEVRLLYGIAAPRIPDSYYDSLLAQLDARLPGPGTLAQRYMKFRERLRIPPSRLDTVYRTAIASCRARTLEHLALPTEASVRFDFVRGKSWATSMRFEGGFASYAEVNVDLPVLAPSALDFGCHDAYPGWHVYNVMAEADLVKGRGWVEYTIAPIFSRQSIVADGIAAVGLELAFPDSQRVIFERDTLFPLAGLDPALAVEYAPILEIMDALSSADIGVARRYLDGEIDRAAAERLVARHRLTTPEAAVKLVQFADAYRSYVMTEGVGRDQVRGWLARHGGGTPEGRWRAFDALLRVPPPQLLR